MLPEKTAKTLALRTVLPSESRKATAMKNHRLAWAGLIAANVVTLGVLGFYRTSGAAPQAGQLPFSNAVEQRNAMVRELREIKDLLKEQNALLRANQRDSGADERSRK